MSDSLKIPDCCIIYDTEFTSWPGAQERDWSGENEHRELVQIAAIRINANTLCEIDQPFNMLIAPRLNPILSDYFIDLTGITQADLDRYSTTFEDAYTAFCTYCGNSPAYAFGRDDHVINENITLYALTDHLPAFESHTLVPWFENNIPEIFNGTGVCSGTLARAVGADLNAPAHNALNDVRSIRAALHHLHFTRGYPNALYDI